MPEKAPTCTDCHAVPCAIPTMTTPQCTDQCVVVACTDVDHAPVCDMPCPGNHCDLDCADASNCRDCNGFDEFLECCTDFHSYYEEPRNNPETTWLWDASLKTFVCTCGGGSTMESIPVDCTVDSTPVDSPPSPIFTPSSDFAAVSDTASTPSPRAVPATVDVPSHLTCMWGDCGASFPSLSDLAEHVNLVHLCHPPSPAIPSSSDVPDLFATFCQWKDCNIYPTPDSVPGPSSGDMEAMFSALSSHLFHDHLGLHTSPTCLFRIQPSEPLRDGSPPAEIPAVPPASSSEDECHEGHVCKWVSCGQSFASLDDLTSHLTSVHVGSGKNSYDCYWQDCPRHEKSGFASKQKLCRHLQSHTGHRPFQCQTCLQNFSEAATLQQHMRRHTQEKPYLCDYPGCGKSFAITGALTIHKRTHNGDKPFKCPHCEKAFAESSNLSKHLRTHTGAKPYTCTEPGCNKSFARADQLTRHARVHKKVSNG